MEVNLEIAPGCYIHNVFFVVVVPVNIKTGCNSFAVLRNRVVYIYIHLLKPTGHLGADKSRASSASCT